MIEVVFWICVALLAYVYAGYPLIAIALAHAFGRGVRQGAALQPTVTVVISAYNEERHIREKIDHVLALQYPGEKLQVIVVSDASSDRTDRIVSEHPAANVELVRVEGRQGKTACQNAAVTAARGEIVMFTDATTRIAPDALTVMVENFADPQVGCVAGSLRYIPTGTDPTSLGGTAYWDYEARLRRAESALGSLIGVSGCLYCVRRSSYRSIPPGLISDFVIAMRVREQGLRTVLEPRALCYEETLTDAERELSMRTRVSLRSLVALLAERRYLNPLRYGRFAWQLWSHKLLRYLAPFFWLVALVSCGLIARTSAFYQVLLAAQLAVLLMGVLGFGLQATHRRLGIVAKPYYLVLTNLASLLAAWRLLRGERMVTWKPIR
jgi:cellulose synthase/poly-beta-1,6-N-acetylglucosamine synthase-like glycosyltransferase